MIRHNDIRKLSFGRVIVSIVLIFFFLPLLAMAQGQQPPVTIDFEQFSAPVDQSDQVTTLNAGSATFMGSGVFHNYQTWSLDQTHVFANG